MNKFDKFQRILITFLIAVSFFYGGYFMGKKGYVIDVKQNPPKINVYNQRPVDQEIDFTLFWDVWNSIQNDYLERPVDGQEMLYGAISGMVESLGDPYTTFLSPDMNKSFESTLNGTYEGIGAEIGIEENQLIVVSPLDGSPAKEAGVKSGDKILEIEGENTAGLNVTEAVSRIRGSAGTISTLKLQRNTEEPFVVHIKRESIATSSVIWNDEGEGTAYVRISRFGSETNADWAKAVKEINVQMPQLDVLIVDVRGNPGGYMLSAVNIVDEFVKEGPITWQEDASGNQTSMDAQRVGVFENLPKVYILIDEGSASAAEILAAALRESIDASVIGAKSYGKGTIQDSREFEDGSGVHITVAKWLTPKKVWVHKVGVTPDIEVEFDEQRYINDHVDTQLEKALELAKQI